MSKDDPSPLPGRTLAVAFGVVSIVSYLAGAPLVLFALQDGSGRLPDALRLGVGGVNLSSLAVGLGLYPGLPLAASTAFAYASNEYEFDWTTFFMLSVSLLLVTAAWTLGYFIIVGHALGPIGD